MSDTSTANVGGRWLDPFERVSTEAMNLAFEATLVVDQRHHIVMLNPAAERVLRCTAAQALGSALERFVPTRYHQQHRQEVAAYVHAMQPLPADTLPANAQRWHGRVAALRYDGSEFPAEVAIAPLASAQGAGGHWYCALLRDLTHEHSLKEEIDRLKQRMRAVFELAPIGIWITDRDRIVFANQACAALFGTSDRGALIGRSIFELLAQDSHGTVRGKIAEALNGQGVVPMLQERIARLDGEPREVEIALASLPDHGQTAVQMVLSDITERERNKRAIERSRGELRRLTASLVDAREEERKRIARELHDELGQRLTALKMELSMLAPHPEAAAQASEHLQSALAMLDDTVSAVRRIATHLRPAMLDDLGLHAAIEWLARDTSRRLGLPIEVDLQDGPPALSDSQATALYRMVQEALTNVSRHARATRVKVALRQDGQALVLTVHDDGVGLPEDALSRRGSFGLMGLRERALGLDGELHLHSAPGGGTQLMVRLPLAAPEGAPRHADATP